MDGGTLIFATEGLGIGQDIILNAGGGTVNTNGFISSQLAGTITGSGGFTVTGTGSLSLDASTSYSGATLVEAGLLANGNNVLSAASAFTVNAGLTIVGPQTIGSLSGSGTIASSFSISGTLNTGGNNSNTTFTGQLNDSNGPSSILSLNKQGTGTFTLSGANT